MYLGQRIAVVMPIHNEEEQVAGAISRVPRFADLIIAVDDGSTDGTWATLMRLEDERLVRLRHEKNRGVGSATKTGYRYSLEADADLIAVMDGDGQMDGDDLAGLLDCAISGADYVKGNRFLSPQSISAMPPVRYAANVFLSWLTGLAAAFNEKVDAQCGYTVIRRSALWRLDLAQMYDRYGFPNEMLFAASRAGLVVRSVAVRTLYGDEVSGINPLTALPTILYLIGRNYLRRKRSLKTEFCMNAVQRGNTETAE